MYMYIVQSNLQFTSMFVNSAVVILPQNSMYVSHLKVEAGSRRDNRKSSFISHQFPYLQCKYPAVAGQYCLLFLCDASLNYIMQTCSQWKNHRFLLPGKCNYKQAGHTLVYPRALETVAMEDFQMQNYLVPKG